MVKQIITSILIIVFLSSCSAIRTLNFTSNKQVSTVNNPDYKAKFIEDISYTPQIKAEKGDDKAEVKEKLSAQLVNVNELSSVKNSDPNNLNDLTFNRTSKVENSSALKLKYAVLLNSEVESLPQESLLEAVDQWYGVRYRMGGISKKGVDCSGFSLAIYSAVYGIMLPRISRDQYKVCRKISTTEIEEGDLVFFNTLGHGVSHVGIYLGNNKFIHASVSRGVMVSDLFDSYYLKKFVGAGRIENKQIIAGN